MIALKVIGIVLACIVGLTLLGFCLFGIFIFICMCEQCKQNIREFENEK